MASLDGGHSKNASFASSNHSLTGSSMVPSGLGNRVPSFSRRKPRVAVHTDRSGGSPSSEASGILATVSAHTDCHSATVGRNAPPHPDSMRMAVRAARIPFVAPSRYIEAALSGYARRMVQRHDLGPDVRAALGAIVG